ncbi:MAG: hypothetical protein H6502_03455 [Candidatus Woesearchaeota archaeon]|nr:MAG: hypothetical protein H6502_03455 [Candidatus Woesearchaeota archaeon]
MENKSLPLEERTLFLRVVGRSEEITSSSLQFNLLLAALDASQERILGVTAMPVSVDEYAQYVDGTLLSVPVYSGNGEMWYFTREEAQINRQ